MGPDRVLVAIRREEVGRCRSCPAQHEAPNDQLAYKETLVYREGGTQARAGARGWVQHNKTCEGFSLQKPELKEMLSTSVLLPVHCALFSVLRAYLIFGSSP